MVAVLRVKRRGQEEGSSGGVRRRGEEERCAVPRWPGWRVCPGGVRRRSGKGKRVTGRADRER